mmetsp:Transcript_88752/g.248337  ORF Transcript_88752/g.248337 Transcript_88752/m.248337 type:complete len:218 (-) Transcript_88752:604-1257(-)
MNDALHRFTMKRNGMPSPGLSRRVSPAEERTRPFVRVHTCLRLHQHSRLHLQLQGEAAGLGQTFVGVDDDADGVCDQNHRLLFLIQQDTELPKLSRDKVGQNVIVLNVHGVIGDWPFKAIAAVGAVLGPRSMSRPNGRRQQPRRRAAVPEGEGVGGGLRSRRRRRHILWSQAFSTEVHLQGEAVQRREPGAGGQIQLDTCAICDDEEARLSQQVLLL